MKITAFIIIVFCIQVSAATFAQNVTLHESGTPLAKVISAIKQQTNYTFFYNNDWLSNAKPVNVQVKNASLSDALKLIFKDQPFNYAIVNTTIVLTLRNSETANKTIQTPVPITISGRVVDTTGTPLNGATLSVKNGKKYLTNDKGEFTLTAESGDEITVSFIGYMPFTFKANESQVYQTITLRTATSKLEEVVVSYSNGYQQLPKERLTGSFDTIDVKTYNRGVSTDVLSRLDGIANSLFFNKAGGMDNDIYIRGTSSITLSSQPLIVLDGFPYTGDYNNINPNNIESVTILKDAAAASIWGARAGNGVIVLTTKKAKYNQKFQLNFNSNISVQDKPDLFKSRAHMSSNDFIDVEKYLFDQGFYDADITSYDHRVLSPVVEILNNQRNGLITADQANQKINALRGLDNRSQIEKYLYAREINQQHSLSMSGGNQVVNYYLSGGYDHNDNVGGQPGNNFEKKTIHSVAGFKPIPKLDVQVGIDYARTDGASSFNSLSGAGGGKGPYYPYAMLADANGNPLVLPRDYAQNFKDTAGNGKLLDWNYRPLQERNMRDLSEMTNNLLFNVSLKYSLTNSLALFVQYQNEYNSSQRKDIVPFQSYQIRNLINQFTQDDGSGTLNYPIPMGGTIDLSNTQLSRYNFRPMLTFDKIISEKHEITAVAGFEVNQARATANSIPTGYGYNPDNLTTVIAPTNTYFTYYDGIGGGSFGNSLGFAEQLNRFVSYYANLGYTFNKKYTFTASARKDASNLFGVNTNNRKVPLWSAGLRWKISDETFYNSELIPNLALRTSFGYSGNSSSSIPALATITYNTNSYLTGLPYADVFTPPNPDLRWEKIGQLNVGLDFGFKDNVVTGSVEYYHKNGVDLLALTPVDITTGYSFLTKNSANMVTNGIDLALNFKAGNSTGLLWTSTLNVNYVKSRITKYLLKRSSAADYVSSGGTISPFEGEDPYTIRVYKFAGLDPQTGDPQGYINNQISKDYDKLVLPGNINELVKKGTNRPPFFGNIINTFSWKGLSVSANINFRFGYNLQKSTIMYSDLFNNWGQNIEFASRWQKSGDELHTTVPSMVYPINSNRDRFYQNSEANIIKGDVIRLQDFKINYDFKSIKLGSYSIKQFGVYMYATNLGIIWKANKDDIDPDFPSGVATPKMFALGIHTSF